MEDVHKFWEANHRKYNYTVITQTAKRFFKPDHNNRIHWKKITRHRLTDMPEIIQLNVILFFFFSPDSYKMKMRQHFIYFFSEAFFPSLYAYMLNSFHFQINFKWEDMKLYVSDRTHIPRKNTFFNFFHTVGIQSKTLFWNISWLPESNTLSPWAQLQYSLSSCNFQDKHIVLPKWIMKIQVNMKAI